MLSEILKKKPEKLFINRIVDALQKGMKETCVCCYLA